MTNFNRAELIGERGARIKLPLELATSQFKNTFNEAALGEIATQLTCSEFAGILDLMWALDMITDDEVHQLEDMHLAGDDDDDLCIEELIEAVQER